ncbi:hypothetical protein MA16_Dca027911 [Dendrobium catenatum]|uniref:Tf2-1-like SH3-like domain-containing protein n=1 Tax=Dendrobium catenatum TaxID=906689 RepID=A0A2I0VAS8_9ASPA|nr:hypothetical protein MA16_Dca027911 [Dendrobium catenatum]
MKRQADAHRRDIQFELGEKVFLKLRPYRQKTLANGRNEKLSPRYFGPYEIVDKIGAVACCLKTPIRHYPSNIPCVTTEKGHRGVCNQCRIASNFD